MSCPTCNTGNQVLKKVGIFAFNRDKTPKKTELEVLVNEEPKKEVKNTEIIPTPVAPKLALPTIKEMAFSITQAVKDSLIQAANTGQILATNEKLARRMDLCAKCEFLIAESSRCSKCGCFMNVKTRLDASKCPVGKW